MLNKQSDQIQWIDRLLFLPLDSLNLVAKVVKNALASISATIPSSLKHINTAPPTDIHQKRQMITRPSLNIQQNSLPDWQQTRVKQLLQKSINPPTASRHWIHFRFGQQQFFTFLFLGRRCKRDCGFNWPAVHPTRARAKKCANSLNSFAPVPVLMNWAARKMLASGKSVLLALFALPAIINQVSGPLHEICNHARGRFSLLSLSVARQTLCSADWWIITLMVRHLLGRAINNASQPVHVHSDSAKWHFVPGDCGCLSLKTEIDG